MCGFAGYFNLKNSKFEINQSWLNNMQQALVHRGPDGYQMWSDNDHQIALVHRRLSIIDLSDAASQPMMDKNKQVIICVNGEIYNYKELQQELMSLGHIFVSSSDSEVVLHGYKQWGIDILLNKLDGMFAFSLYDFKTNELFLVRDRIGVKPLYFSLVDNIVSFASEIKALWQLPWIHKKINKESVYHYLTYLATPAPMTMWQDVYKIPAGFYIKIDKQKKMHVTQWYDLAKKLVKHASGQNEQYYVDQIRSRLRRSIKKRMMSDVPFGVFLSGGIDSSLNVALMSEFTDKVKTFTVAFSDGPEYNELKWARKIAQMYDTDHHEIIIDESDAFNFFQQMVYHQDEPLGDCVCVPIHFVSKLAKQHNVTVVQVGEGSDELFCGYNQYAQYVDTYRWWHTTQKFVPDIAKKGMFYGAQKLFPNKFSKLDILNNWAHNKELFYSGAVVFNEYMKQTQLHITSHTPANEIMQMFFPQMHLTDSYAMADWYRNQLYKEVQNADVLTQMGYLELKHRLPELLLMRVDKMSMATSIEARVPFLDSALVEFALSMPQKFKYHNGITKYILKKAAETILPHDIIYRKKMGFAAPTTRWFKQGKQFNDYFGDLLSTKQGDWQDVLDMNTIKKMYQQNRNDASIDYSYHLWAVQNVLACM
jgi:asparagine synthase (glutamine-hydrolysing)